MHAACKVQSPDGDPPQVDAAFGLRGCQSLPGGNVECPHPDEGYQLVNENHTPPLRVEILV